MFISSLTLATPSLIIGKQAISDFLGVVHARQLIDNKHKYFKSQL